MSSATPALIILSVLFLAMAAYAAYLIQKLNEAKDRAEAFRFTGLTVLDWLEAEVSKRRNAERLHALAEQQVDALSKRRTRAALDLIEAQLRRDDAERAVDFLLARIQRLEAKPQPRPRRRKTA